MSSMAISDHTKLSRKQVNWTNDSGEIDVFEAARYFSDLNEISGYNAGKLSHQKPFKGGRMSFDMPTIRDTLYYNTSLAHGPGVTSTGRDMFPSQAQTHYRENLKEKKHKQPSSPGGRLASFLNSLFSQRSSKKKKTKSMGDSIKDEDDPSPGGASRRRRRSSISHFRIPSMVPDPKPVLDPGSGFRTPPPYAYTPTKSYKDLFIPKENLKPNEKPRSSQGKTTEKYKNTNPNNTAAYKIQENRRTSWADRYPSEEKDFQKIFKEVIIDNDDKINDDVDYGCESDSSSDLFELPNFDYSSSGLPVYESTNVDTIKKGAPISNITR